MIVRMKANAIGMVGVYYMITTLKNLKIAIKNSENKFTWDVKKFLVIKRNYLLIKDNYHNYLINLVIEIIENI